jgi:Transposase, Mutator family
VSKETISRITDKVIEEMNDWAHRPLDEVYAAVFVDAIMVKVRLPSTPLGIGHLVARGANLPTSAAPKGAMLSQRQDSLVENTVPCR